MYSLISYILFFVSVNKIHTTITDNKHDLKVWLCYYWIKYFDPT